MRISAGMLHAAVVMLVTAGPLPAADTLFHECFSKGLHDNWILYGDPSPILCDTMGLPPPSFDNNGDEMYNSGAVSRRSFAIEGGLVLQSDMYVTSNPRGSWIEGMLALLLSDMLVYDLSGATGPGISLFYAYSGEMDHNTPHLQGHLRTGIDCGSRNEKNRLVHFNDYLDGWHSFRLEIGPDLRASFHVDDFLLHETEIALSSADDSVRIVLGSRSGAWGRVFHDNVVLYRP